jgi:outer membrane lipopolysaccharide assembly protein LptE/RlpB
MSRARAWLALCIAAAGCVCSCGYTTSSASIPPHLKTLAIPVFENGTTEPGLEQTITTEVVARFVADNHFKIVDERQADAILRGRVTSYKNTVFGFSVQTQSQEYQAAVGVSVVMKDVVRNRELWHADNLIKTANYYVVDVPGQPAKTELEGRQDAIKKIADEIVARTVQGW